MHFKHMVQIIPMETIIKMKKHFEAALIFSKFLFRKCFARKGRTLHQSLNS